MGLYGWTERGLEGPLGFLLRVPDLESRRAKLESRYGSEVNLGQLANLLSAALTIRPPDRWFFTDPPANWVLEEIEAGTGELDHRVRVACRRLEQSLVELTPDTFLSLITQLAFCPSRLHRAAGAPADITEEEVFLAWVGEHESPDGAPPRTPPIRPWEEAIDAGLELSTAKPDLFRQAVGLAPFRTSAWIEAALRLHPEREPELRPFQRVSRWDRIPSDPSLWSGLERLDTGDSWVRNLEFMAHLPRLKQLRTEGYEIRDLSPIASCVDLEDLELPGAESNDWSPVVTLPKLRRLSGTIEEAPSADAEKYFPSLESLDLVPSGSFVGNFVGISTLRKVFLFEATIPESLSDLNWPNLRELELHLTYTPSLDWIREFRLLERLSIFGGDVDRLDVLADLGHLRALELTMNPISSLAPLADLPELRLATVESSQVSDLIPLQGCLRLEHLSVTSSPLTSVAPLEGLTHLKTVDLTSTRVADLAPLAACSSLTRLNLSYCEVREITPLLGLSHLESLDLFHCPVSNIQELKKIPNLHRVRLPNGRSWFPKSQFPRQSVSLQ